jgi:hypothetical protein
MYIYTYLYIYYIQYIINIERHYVGYIYVYKFIHI